MQNGLKGIVLSLLLLLATIGPWQVCRAESDVQVSILTCAPDDDVYALYGHTAIRCKDAATNFDYVFNYGVFSFNQPFFILRFVLGRCDYMLQPVPWDYFVYEYKTRGREVTEQVLNLREEEARTILANLIEEARPENCTYRYDFFRNNCTTKVRDAIERGLNETVVYPELSEAQGTTYRQMLHEYNEVEPWSSEGCDLLLGADVDSVLTQRAATFLPYYYLHFADKAMVRDSINNQRPLVKERRVVVACPPVHVDPFLPLSPQLTAWLLLAVFLLIACLECFLHYQFWIIDALLLSVQGIISLLLLFLMLISAHPGVHQNWLVLLFHPFAFWGLYLTVKAAWKREKTYWHAVNCCLIVAFLVFSAWMPQNFGKIVIPLTLILLTRPVSYMLYYRK